jgi:hypothetical protein
MAPGSDPLERLAQHGVRLSSGYALIGDDERRRAIQAIPALLALHLVESVVVPMRARGCDEFLAIEPGRIA